MGQSEVFNNNREKPRTEPNGTYLRRNPQFPSIFVIPAQAGIQENGDNGWLWIPACAGMTVVLVLSKCHSGQDQVFAKIANRTKALLFDRLRTCIPAIPFLHATYRLRGRIAWQSSPFM